MTHFERSMLHTPKLCFFLMIVHPPRSTHFPYTTLFRSDHYWTYFKDENHTLRPKRSIWLKKGSPFGPFIRTSKDHISELHSLASRRSCLLVDFNTLLALLG